MHHGPITSNAPMGGCKSLWWSSQRREKHIELGERVQKRKETCCFMPYFFYSYISRQACKWFHKYMYLSKLKWYHHHGTTNAQCFNGCHAKLYVSFLFWVCKQMQHSKNGSISFSWVLHHWKTHWANVCTYAPAALTDPFTSQDMRHDTVCISTHYKPRLWTDSRVTPTQIGKAEGLDITD